MTQSLVPWWQLSGDDNPEPLKDKKVIKKANKAKKKTSPKFTSLPKQAGDPLIAFPKESNLVITADTSLIYMTKNKQACIVLGYKISTGYKVISIVGLKGKLAQGSKIINDANVNNISEMVKKMASFAHHRLHKKIPYKLENIISSEVLLEQQLNYLISLEPCQVPLAKLEEIKIVDLSVKEICDLVEL